MEYKILALIGMIFCHIVDDYYLQGWLASAKQKEWWQKNAPEPLYRYDYLMALFMHAFSWTCSIMLVPALKAVLFGGNWNPLVFIGNLLIHMYVDDLKANQKKINLIQDQIVHMTQIIWTWYVFII